MPGLICTYCGQQMEGGLEDLTNHLIIDHSIVFNRKNTFRCGQEGCELEYDLYISLKRHLISIHGHLAATSDPDNVENENRNENDDVNLSGNDDDVGQSDHGEEDVNLNDMLDQDMDVEFNDLNEESESEEEPGDFDYRRVIPTLSKLAASICADMRSNSAVTGAVHSQVFDYLSTTFDLLVKDLNTEVQSVLREAHIKPEIKSDVLNKFTVKSPFEGLNSIDNTMKHLKKHFKFVEPNQCQLSERMEMVKNRKGGRVPRMIKKTFQYVSILQVIELVLSNDVVRDALHSETDASDGFMEKYRDGQHVRTRLLFTVCHHGVQLQIYYDDLEVVNALGSRTCVHKLGAFYFRILNLPQYINSALGGSHLFTLCYSNDLKKYSFRKVLEPFLKDLKMFERGVNMTFNAQEVLVKGTVVSACGDGLAMHELFGLLGPQCKYFCRECKISREDLLPGRIYCEHFRTREEYAQQIQLLKENPYTMRYRTETGLKEECPLHESMYFHLTDNHVFDAMHDFLEGITQFEVKLVLNHFVQNGLFTVEALNGRIHSYDYGETEIKNKPSSNFTRESLQNVLRDHALKQKAAQMLLVGVLPFLLSDWVPEGHKVMSLILLLLDIMNIVFTPKLHSGTIFQLEILIREHNDLFMELFPEANFINKHHHVTHYPRFNTKMGPAILHSCMRFEAKHHDLARHGAVCCNFRNLSKTLARFCQIIQTKHWGDPGSSVWDNAHSNGGARRLVADLPFSDQLEMGFELNREGYVFIPTENVFGTEYKRNLFVVVSYGLETEENLQIFGEITDLIVIHSSALVLVVKTWSTQFYSDDFKAYAIEENATEKLILTSDLPDYRPISRCSIREIANVCNVPNVL